MKKDFFQKTILAFSPADFPWRKTRDPYRIWVSEIFLQQTQVARVKKFYARFLQKFPDIFALAAADWESFLPVFRGLGFYSRGKNMLKTAKIIAKNFSGQFPRDFSALKKLPGIGDYTAAAILSFAFDEKMPALDTNLKRVFARFFGENFDPKKYFSKIQNPALFNHLLMDFGREKCAAKNPKCEKCPLAEKCDFLKSGKKDAFLKKSADKKIGKTATKKAIEVAAAVIRDGERFLIAKKGDIWEFVGGKRERGESWRAAVKREVFEEIGVEVSVRPAFFEHISGDLKIRFFRCQILRGTPKKTEHDKLQWILAADFQKFPMRKTNAPAILKLQKMRNLP